MALPLSTSSESGFLPIQIYCAMPPATKKHKAPVRNPAAAKKKSRPEPKAMPKPGSVPVAIEAEATPVLALL